MKNTTHLFALPSFLEGVARIIDFGGTLDNYNWSDNPDLDNQKALRSDWAAILPDCESDSLVKQAAQELVANPELQEIIKLANRPAQGSASLSREA